MKISRLIQLSILTFAFAGLPGSNASAATSKLDFPDATAEIYKKASGDDLWIYRFEPSGHDASKDKRPAVVFFFGGGWNGGTPNQFVPHCRYLASRGIVAMVADYRVKSRQGATPDQCVADGKSAIRWVRQHAERLGINPAKILAGGGSAGGHVAAATGICEGFDEPGEELSISSKPAALLLFNPVYDNGPKGYGHDRVTEWFPAISPAHNLTKDDPPAIVFLGTEDKLIPVSTADTFRDKMLALDIPSVLHTYEGAPHGFFNRGKKPDHFSDTLVKLDAFLVELGYLKGEVDLDKIKELAGS